MQVWVVGGRRPEMKGEKEAEHDGEDGDDALTLAGHAAGERRFCAAHSDGEARGYWG